MPQAAKRLLSSYGNTADVSQNINVTATIQQLESIDQKITIILAMELSARTNDHSIKKLNQLYKQLDTYAVELNTVTANNNKQINVITVQNIQTSLNKTQRLCIFINLLLAETHAYIFNSRGTKLINNKIKEHLNNAETYIKTASLLFDQIYNLLEPQEKLDLQAAILEQTHFIKHLLARIFLHRSSQAGT